MPQSAGAEGQLGTLWVRGRNRILCNALRISTGDNLWIDRFNPAMQDASDRSCSLDWRSARGSVDRSLNADLNDVGTHYGKDCVLVALDVDQVVGTGIVCSDLPKGRSCGCQSTVIIGDVELQRTSSRH